MAYLCLHSPNTMKETRSNTPLLFADAFKGDEFYVSRSLGKKSRLSLKTIDRPLRDKLILDDVLLNHVGDEKFKSIGGIGRTTKKEIKKVNKVMPKEPNKEWKLNDKVVSHNK
ncbi:hypothetical protein Tco_0221147 [Tanacetum coccineum]